MTGKEKILQFLSKFGPAPDHEMAERLKMSPSSVRTRRHELELEGILIPVGKCLTDYGRETWVWGIRE